MAAARSDGCWFRALRQQGYDTYSGSSDAADGSGPRDRIAATLVTVLSIATQWRVGLGRCGLGQ